MLLGSWLSCVCRCDDGLFTGTVVTRCWAPAGISPLSGTTLQSIRAALRFLSFPQLLEEVHWEGEWSIKEPVGGTTLHWPQHWFAAVLLKTPSPPVPTFCKLLFSSQTCKFFKRQGITGWSEKDLGGTLPYCSPFSQPLPSLFLQLFWEMWLLLVLSGELPRIWNNLMWTGTFSVSFARTAVISREPGTSCSLTMMLSVLIFIRKASPESTKSGRGPTM